MSLRTTIFLGIIIATSLAQEEEKEFNFIKPNDDAGFFIPYKKLTDPEKYLKTGKGY